MDAALALPVCCCRAWWRLDLTTGNGNPGPLDPPGSAYDPAEAVIHDLTRSLDTRLQRLGAPVTGHFHCGTHHRA